jgi:ribose transport system substrate-binding protein
LRRFDYQGVDFIIKPKDPDALVEVTKVANKAGIPLFIIDSSINPAAEFVTQFNRTVSKR